MKKFKVLSPAEKWYAAKVFKSGYNPIKKRKATKAEVYIAGLESKYGRRII